MADRVIPFSAAAQAYARVQPAQVRAIAQVRPTQRTEPRDTLSLSDAARARTQPTNSLAAAKVPGPVDFNASAAPSAQGALPIYTHPADRNSAATSINAGRLIDTQA